MAGLETELTTQAIPEYYKNISCRILQHTTRHQLGLHLNLTDVVRGHDWRKLAEELGCSILEIDNMERDKSPFLSVFQHAIRENTNLHRFLEIIISMPRPDIMEACKGMIIRDVQKHKDTIQDPEVNTSSRPPLTLGEAQTGEPEYFDAFVSYHPQDAKFIDELIERLEEEMNFKLCINERDLCIGIGQNEAMAELIEKRCKRVIIVLSNSYIESTDEGNSLRWQLGFAQALAPSAHRINKLIPIVIQEGIQVPSILRPYSVSHYCNPAQSRWFWNKLEQSLQATPVQDFGGYVGPREGRLRRYYQNRSEEIAAGQVENIPQLPQRNSNCADNRSLDSGFGSHSSLYSQR